MKRLEAFEKAMSLVGKAKSEFGIEVNTNELQNEIMHEFAGPVVWSREALEDWANRPLLERLARTPGFLIPPKQARYVRIEHTFSIIIMFTFGAYFLTFVFAIAVNISVKEMVLLVLYSIFYLFLWFMSRLSILSSSKIALQKVRAMPESRTAEVKTGSRAAGLLPEATC
jgi:hypothetical protein